MNAIREIKGFFGRHLLTKEKINDPELTKARLQKCNSCKMNQNGTCKICTCPIASKILSKVNIDVRSLNFEETHCPLGKWPVREEDGKISGSDLNITNFYRKLKGKSELFIN